ncbi:hypothetical protein CMI37_26225 [Candidatus Pacearchaeota archaeon]|nr:hypothetical protein [Candidatus Pacearchaeota archaeon]|tara:strand:+ start:1814 stop:2299 length:486 start_codon:yes stop_codon:yes gene_type:complete
MKRGIVAGLVPVILGSYAVAASGSDLGHRKDFSFAPYGVKVKQDNVWVTGDLEEGIATFYTKIKNFGDIQLSSDVIHSLNDPANSQRQFSLDLSPGDNSQNQTTFDIPPGSFVFSSDIIISDDNMTNNYIEYSFNVIPEPSTFAYVLWSIPAFQMFRRQRR